MVSLPQRTTWIATGNNLMPYGDMTRRAYMISIDPMIADPHLRDTSEFKHPRIIEHVGKNRGNYLAALLTMARAWYVDGRKPGKQILGSFESWASTIGGILNHAGIEGFLCDIKEQQSAGDDEASELFELLGAIWDLYQDTEFTSKELAKTLIETNKHLKQEDYQSMRGDSMSSYLKEDTPAKYVKGAIVLGCLPQHIVKLVRDGIEQGATRSLGIYFSQKKDRRISVDGQTYHLSAPRKVKRVQRFAVVFDKNG